MSTGNSLAVQWLGLGAFTARAQVQSLVEELRSHKPPGQERKKKVVSTVEVEDYEFEVVPICLMIVLPSAKLLPLCGSKEGQGLVHGSAGQVQKSTRM